MPKTIITHTGDGTTTAFALPEKPCQTYNVIVGGDGLDELSFNLDTTNGNAVLTTAPMVGKRVTIAGYNSVTDRKIMTREGELNEIVTSHVAVLEDNVDKVDCAITGVETLTTDVDELKITAKQPGPQGPKGDKGDPGTPGVGTGGRGIHRADVYEPWSPGKTNFNNTFLVSENGQENTTGHLNTASGSGALKANTTGRWNTATGTGALNVNTTGHDNTAMGTWTLNKNTTGHRNTASGTNALRENTTGHRNTATGWSSLLLNTTGFWNTATGTSALNVNTTGHDNTATGGWALNKNTAGHRNTASGANALRENTTGSNNTATGWSSLLLNTTGKENTASGVEALRANTTGNHNTATGTNALRSNTTGYRNTATGLDALKFNTTGNWNAASGSEALLYNTTGGDNTASGAAALKANTTGNTNAALGCRALSSNTIGSKNIGIGVEANAPREDTSNYLNIGGTLKGDLYTGNLTLKGTLTQNSDERLKENVVEIANGLECVKALRPVKYTRKEISDPIFAKDEEGNPIYPNPMPEGGQRGSDEVEFGLIAQEVEQHCPELVSTSPYAEGYKAVDYAKLNVLLIKAVQQQQQEIELLKAETESLKSQLNPPPLGN